MSDSFYNSPYIEPWASLLPKANHLWFLELAKLSLQFMPAAPLSVLCPLHCGPHRPMAAIHRHGFTSGPAKISFLRGTSLTAPLATEVSFPSMILTEPCLAPSITALTLTARFICAALILALRSCLPRREAKDTAWARLFGMTPSAASALVTAALKWLHNTINFIGKV